MLVVSSIAKQPFVVGLAALPWTALGGLRLGSLALAVGAVWLSARRAPAPLDETLRQPV
ncbi:hypothetical protein [Deinococcus radiophilus]|uniref:hypothetical protein n=1 Tax=Deinococcus radiophilus TaxID=32062 RepID=UPI0014766AFB|nr:hypothetical protein [Deinococcus radiophilus]UFA50028.1 hypothetical protein LMT64_09080 [Deinococcus radiophilus]